MNQTANAFSVDVEDYFQVAAFDGVIDRSEWHDWPSRVEANTDRVLGILDEAGIKGTFFVLGWVAERHPGLVPRIAAAGHEVGCHGYAHQRIYTQSPESFREETVRSKALLEAQSGQAVSGYRAATYSINRDSLWALDVLAEAGFTYDSSIFPVVHDLYGIPDAPLDPHRMATPSGASLVEFPITVLPFAGLRIPFGGGGYFRLFPYGLTRWGLSRVRARGRTAVFYMHPWEVDPEQPRVSGAGWRSRFRHYNNLNRFERRLRALLRDFAFAPLRSVLAAQGLLPG